MKLHDLAPSRGAKHKPKRIGRGPGSGHGKTATKGHKGLKARSGGGKFGQGLNASAGVVTTVAGALASF